MRLHSEIAATQQPGVADVLVQYVVRVYESTGANRRRNHTTYRDGYPSCENLRSHLGEMAKAVNESISSCHPSTNTKSIYPEPIREELQPCIVRADRHLHCRRWQASVASIGGKHTPAYPAQASPSRMRLGCQERAGCSLQCVEGDREPSSPCVRTPGESKRIHAYRSDIGTKLNRPDRTILPHRTIFFKPH